jgi:hypothetical protein
VDREFGAGENALFVESPLHDGCEVRSLGGKAKFCTSNVDNLLA